MITIDTFISKEASRVYGDLTEKIAFQVNVDPASVGGAIAGSYLATRHYQNKLDEAEPKPSIENGSYQQVQNLMSNLKIVFTPINVIFSVNDQVFEIIKTNEMSPSMREAFMQKDGEYFKKLLLNKINMELQLAEQVFAQRLVSAQGAQQPVQQANYVNKQAYLLELENDEFEKVASASMKGLDESIQLPIPVSFDSIRPFSVSTPVMETIEKVAGIFDYFKRDPHEVLDLGDLKANVKIGFLPDRVVFLYNGQLLEQLSVMNMDEVAYEAFGKKNKEYFLNLFANKADEASALNNALYNKEQEEKTAASLEEVVEDLTQDPMDKSDMDLFQDGDVHPLVYDRVLSNKYGKNWVDNELEAILKQVEIDFDLKDGMSSMALNKIGMIHTMAGENSELFATPFSFEKFVRVMNSKEILFDEFQGNVSFEEIMFALEIAQAYESDDIYLTFPRELAEYIAEELYQDDVRYVSDQLYNEGIEGEREFFDTINGFLMRKWKNLDSKNIFEDKELALCNRFTESIVSCSEKVLREFAEKIHAEGNMAENVRKILKDERIIDGAPAEKREAALNLSTDTIIRHFITGMFLEIKRDEFEASMIEIESKEKAGE